MPLTVEERLDAIEKVLAETVQALVEIGEAVTRLEHNLDRVESNVDDNLDGWYDVDNRGKDGSDMGNSVMPPCAWCGRPGATFVACHSHCGRSHIGRRTMGNAKARGTYEERKAMALVKKAANAEKALAEIRQTPRRKTVIGSGSGSLAMIAAIASLGARHPR